VVAQHQPPPTAHQQWSGWAIGNQINQACRLPPPSVATRTHMGERGLGHSVCTGPRSQPVSNLAWSSSALLFLRSRSGYSQSFGSQRNASSLHPRVCLTPTRHQASVVPSVPASRLRSVRPWRHSTLPTHVLLWPMLGLYYFFEWLILISSEKGR
jgi:hypothetical protein